MEASHIVLCVIELVWLAVVDQIVIVWRVKVIALFLGHNVSAIQVLYIVKY